MQTYRSTLSTVLFLLPIFVIGQSYDLGTPSYSSSNTRSISAIHILKKAYEETSGIFLKDQPFSLYMDVYAKAISSPEDTTYIYKGKTNYHYKKGYKSQDGEFLRNYREMAENPYSGISSFILKDRRFWGGIFLQDNAEAPCPSSNTACWKKTFPVSEYTEVDYQGKKVHEVKFSLMSPNNSWVEGAFVGQTFKYDMTFLIDPTTYVILKKTTDIYGENFTDQDREADPLLKDYERTDRIWVTIEKEYTSYLGNYYLGKVNTTYKTQYHYPKLGVTSDMYTTQHEYITSKIHFGEIEELPKLKHGFQNTNAETENSSYESSYSVN
ncbi:MAG: hypothetical protein AAF388_12710 [Bacteroidota bacterium]